jgi:hypothetical protein
VLPLVSMAAVEPCPRTVADSEKKTIQTPPEITCYWGTEGPPQPLRQP